MKQVRILLGLSIIASFLFVLLLGGCGQQTKESQVLKLGLLPIEENLPFYVAEQEGMFEQAGINVELISFSSAQEMLAAIQSGQIDGEITDLIVTNLLKKGGTDVRIAAISLGLTPLEGRFAILSSPQSSLRKVEDLKNVNIGGTENTIIHYVIDSLLTKHGFSPEEIQITSIPKFPVRLEMLLHNEVEAAVFTDPLASFAEMQGAHLIIDDTTDNISQTVIIFRNKTLEEKEQAVKVVLKVYEQAGQAINQNPERYRDLIVVKAQVPEALKETYKIPTYSKLQLPSEEQLSKVMQWMVSKKLLSEPFAYEELVATTLLEE
ncbi:MAG: ABC transporter substrate-binding protein [Peptococcaceae bacterium]|jgi:NitT/TauT family transport system substrate-binding protein|nr:ABC transporter substrate-binding protein [Peptococcaceae bacterium]